MIYAQPTSNERISMRYTIARLEPLRTLLAAVRIKMEQIALQTKDKGLRGNILNFVTEMGPCEEQVKSYIISLQHVFPANDISPAIKDENDAYQPVCPFECAKMYEKKIIKVFRGILNDYKVEKEVRELMRTQLNEILYSFLKIKLLNNFSSKELRIETSLF